MKQYSVIMLVLVLVLACVGCNKQQTVQPTEKSEQQESVLTYDEIMALPKIESAVIDRYFFDDLNELAEFCSKVDTKAAAVKMEALDVKYYLGWADCYTGYSVTEVRVTDVADKYNTANIKKNDVLYIVQDEYIDFEGMDDTYAFFSENYGRTVTSNEMLEEGYFELIPQKGTEYVYHIRDNQFPMKVGETYTTFVAETGFKAEGYEKVYGSDDIKPVDSKTTLEEAAKQIGVIYDPECIAIAEEIAALFK